MASNNNNRNKPEDLYRLGLAQQLASSSTSSPQAPASPPSLALPQQHEYEHEHEPPPKPKRLRTETQLNQKRLADRIRHRETRLEGKHRLAKMESDIVDIKASLHDISLHLQALAVPPPVVAGHPLIGAGASPPVARQHEGITSDGGFSPGPFAAEGQAAFLRALPLAQWPAATSTAAAEFNPATRLWKNPTSPPLTARLINCRCGSQHLDRFDALDMCSVTALYQNHIAFSPMQGPTAALPRNPSLPAMMLHSLEENLATYLITGFLRQYKNKSLEHLLGSYLLGYRYMRWRMTPNEDTLRDVPTWLLPTELQKLRPHPVVVDYLPWPRLRDHLCTNNDDHRHSISLYFESMQLAWPPETPIFHQDADGQVALSPDFEMAVGTLEHWRLGPPFSDVFPHLMHLTTA